MVRRVHQGRTALYRLYNAADELIYVGIAHNPRVRWKQHARVQPWWHEVVTREFEWLDTRADAERLEAELIETRHPKYNGHPGMPALDARAFPRTRKKAGWEPTQRLLDLFKRYDEELLAAGRTRDEIEAHLIEVMWAGVTASRIGKFIPWRGPTVMAIAKKAGIPARVPVPGGYEGQPPWAEIEAALHERGVA